MEGAAAAATRRACVSDRRRTQEGREANEGQERAPCRRAEGVVEGQAVEADDGNGVVLKDGRIRPALQSL